MTDTGDVFISPIEKERLEKEIDEICDNGDESFQDVRMYMRDDSQKPKLVVLDFLKD